MALSKVNFNSMNVTPSASKAIKFNSSNNGLETGDIGGSLVLLSTVTASSSGTIDFTSGIDSTYKEYQVHAINVHPEENGRVLSFQTDTGTNTNYNQTVTCTHFTHRHHEDDSATSLGYDTGSDLAQSTSFVPLTSGSTANNNDDNCCSILHLFNPSSTTFVKHFIVRTQNINSTSDPNSNESYVAGYFNTTTALTRIRYKMSSGNIDAGTFKLYGVS